MVLTDDDKVHVKAIWGEVQSHGDTIGAEALDRMFAAHSSTKTYFSHFDLSPGSGDIKAHGKKVINALTQAVNNLDNIAGTLSKLSDKHAHELRVDPQNFEKLRHCILVTIAAHHDGILKADTLVSLDKLLTRVGKVLISKYR